ncbi:MAG: phage Gp37/Gp68 family protein [Bacteroidales bacterium]|nr:phage Gp37/Gp68 family protein [Bacteroidales bacterium]MDD4500869.1 phage Gp37/Gp68 family protein [Bacteroidales bacterium]
MSNTKIEWTDSTWNPVTGCTKVSAGCQHCYAETMARRLTAMGVAKYANGFKVTVHEKSLNEPIKWRKHRNIFVCSMSDLFHEEVPFDFVDKVMAIIEKTPRHSYQILTKRAERMAEYFKTHNIPANVWLGVTVDVAQCKERIEFLRRVKGSNIKFLSCEPLLEDLGPLNLDGIDWIIVGGESGNQARPMKKEWAISIKEQCDAVGKSFFFKQWGTWGADGIKRSKGKNGKELDGEILHSIPASK